MAKTFLENVTFDELVIGQKASLSKTLTQMDINLFAAMSGDVNPAHVDPVFAKSNIFQGIVGHGMWSGSLISALLGTVLPGPGTIYLAQDIQFTKPVRLGDTITITIIAKEKRSNKPVVIFDCHGTNQFEEIVIKGLATVLAPTKKIKIERAHLQPIEIYNPNRFEAVIKTCQNKDAIRTAVVHPVTANVIEAINDLVNAKLIIPILIGPFSKVKAAAIEADIDLTSWEIINTEHSNAAADKAVEMAAEGEIEAIMQGSLSTHELITSIVPTMSGLRTEHRVSHAYVMDAPSYHKPLIVTDGVINIAPNAADKADICQNAITLWRILYGEDKMPKVAVLAATEAVNPKMQATVDASILCKMADRGQIHHGILDGPLPFDMAINKEVAEEKGVRSTVAGDPDILLAPDIESGDILAKQLTFLSHADAAGIVLGARVPVILLSQIDSLRTRLFSCALAIKMATARKEGRIK